MNQHMCSNVSLILYCQLEKTILYCKMSIFISCRLVKNVVILLMDVVLKQIIKLKKYFIQSIIISLGFNKVYKIIV